MRLDDYDDDINVRDLGRGSGGGFGGRGGGAGGIGLLLNFLPLLLGRKMGCGTVLLIAAVGGYFLFAGGGMQMLGGEGSQYAGQQSATAGSTDASQVCNLDPMRKEVCNTLSSVDNTWEGIFRENSSAYKAPTLYFFTESNRSACGAAQSAMGPFYCPADQGVYLDTSFFDELEQRMGAGGDFARSYVIAHEVGHHIQALTGIADQVRKMQARASEAEGNGLQVRMELQADCYAGVWAGRNSDRIEAGDIEEGMTAANAIGDDTLMRSAGRRIVPESFTHGTSEQRMRWLRKGITTGDPAVCNTFEAQQL